MADPRFRHDPETGALRSFSIVNPGNPRVRAMVDTKLAPPCVAVSIGERLGDPEHHTYWEDPDALWAHIKREIVALHALRAAIGRDEAEGPAELDSFSESLRIAAGGA